MAKEERVMEAVRWMGSGATCTRGALRTTSSEWIKDRDSDSLHHIFCSSRRRNAVICINDTACTSTRVRHGPGTMMYANGDIYEGSWANDKKHGSGTFFHISKVRI